MVKYSKSIRAEVVRLFSMGKTGQEVADALNMPPVTAYAIRKSEERKVLAAAASVQREARRINAAARAATEVTEPARPLVAVLPTEIDALRTEIAELKAKLARAERVIDAYKTLLNERDPL